MTWKTLSVASDGPILRVWLDRPAKRNALNGDALERVLQPERAQRPDHVGRDDDARAHLAQLRRLLVHGRLEPGLAQEERGGEPAQAAADDGDAHRYGVLELSRAQ